MSNPTNFFGWQMPEPTDLVTDLPADFEVFGQAVDTDFQYLLGGTTGQVLSKTSATDLDFTWVTANPGDITGVTAGTGISGGGTSGTVTVSIDTAVTADLTTAQTLTNKKLSDSTTTIVDVTDATKAIKFDVAGTTAITGTIATAFTTAKTLTLPDATDTLVGKATTDTLTNKTLTSPALTTPTISTATTNGDILYGTGSGALARLGIGSNGQSLVVASGLPSWATATSGSMTLLSTTSLTSTTTTVSSISQSYKHLYIEISGHNVSAFNPTIVYKTEATATVMYMGQWASTAGVNWYATNGTLGNGQNYGGGTNNNAAWYIYDYTDSTRAKVGSFNQHWLNEGGANIYVNGGMATNHTAAVSSIAMTLSSGTFTAGTIRVYGVL